MPTCTECGQERKGLDPSTWTVVNAHGLRKAWERDKESYFKATRYLEAADHTLDAHDYPPGTVVTIRAEFQLP